MKDVSHIINGSAGFGDRLQRLRKAHGWSQQEAADRCGWSTKGGQSKISNYEKGRIPNDHKDIEALAQIYCTTVQVLLFGEDAHFRSKIRRIPILSWQELRLTRVMNKKSRSSKTKDFLTVPADSRYNLSVFSLRVANDRHAPAIQRGDMLIIDRQKRPKTGQYVVVVGVNQRLNSTPHLCQWVEQGGKPALRETPHAKLTPYDPKKITLYGVVITRITNF